MPGPPESYYAIRLTDYQLEAARRWQELSEAMLQLGSAASDIADGIDRAIGIFVGDRVRTHRYRVTRHGQVLRRPGQKPLLHNGCKPRKRK